MSHLTPIDDRVLVSPLPSDAMTAGGLHLPQIVQAKETGRGVVVAVGPGKDYGDGKRVKPDVAVGDVVMYPKFQATKYEDMMPRDQHGNAFVLLYPNEILGVMVDMALEASAGASHLKVYWDNEEVRDANVA